MHFEILTLFPSMFQGVFSESIIHRAVKRRLASIEVRDLREETSDRHRTVDDYPYGGDAGMVLKPEPAAAAITKATRRLRRYNPKVIFFTPRGEVLTHRIVVSLLEEEAFVLLCGHYKGVDQRVIERYVDRELSIGDYVLSGGEIPAMAFVDSLVRLLPGALGNRDSAERDSFYGGLLGAPQYTRPEEFEGMKVPEVLLSGHHERIRCWRSQQAEELTRRRRPDLWRHYREAIGKE